MNSTILTVSLTAVMAFFGITPYHTIETSTSTELIAEESVAVIVLSSNDQMRFDMSEIMVKAGQKVKLTLKHTGKLPKTAMGHNFVLLAAGTDMAAFAQEAMKASDNEYIPAKNVLAHTKLIGGGESTTIEFTAPKKGTYDFICSFPGHYSLMKGKFIVE